jgi:hypothetical protein
MKHTAIDIEGSIAANGIKSLSDAERHDIAAELIASNGYRCGHQDGAMDSLVTFEMNARKGLVARA